MTELRPMGLPKKKKTAITELFGAEGNETRVVHRGGDENDWPDKRRVAGEKKTGEGKKVGNRREARGGWGGAKRRQTAGPTTLKLVEPS